MRRVIGWIAVLVVGLAVVGVMAYWGMINDGILQFTAAVGSATIGIFIAFFVGWFLMPILDKKEKS